ncbi:hypothetical protein HII36_15960 [Nonomuraea sp. NN258]|uniref:hypothetical protein n=1 Tax=Nonomuraea antri TaxID=2730852 RepID=UPI00156A540A|nr:hypothetical protein [Nonomuraea antri]NRQ33331.1 hypothetical protein [Nonomuraea antri]
MTMRVVVLRHIEDEEGLRVLDARLTDDGDLRIEGHDLGPRVEEFFGAGMTEYEWVHIVRARDFPRLVSTLGGQAGENVLDVLERTCSGENATRIAGLLGTGKPVPAEFWSRVGD